MSVATSVAAGSLRRVMAGGIVLLAALGLVAGALAALPGSASALCEESGIEECETGWAARAAILFEKGATFDVGERTVPVVLDHLWASVTLIGASITLLLGIGVLLGVGTALRPEARGLALGAAAIATISNVPVLVWAMVVLWVQTAQDVALVNFEPTNLWEWGLRHVGPLLALVLGDGMLGDLIHRVRLDTRAILREPYMRTVRALGLGVSRQLLRSLTPSVGELVRSRALFLVGGAIVVEWVFVIDGVGYLVVDSLVGERDRELIEVLAASISVVLVGVVLGVMSELASVAADPRKARVRHPAEAGG